MGEYEGQQDQEEANEGQNTRNPTKSKGWQSQDNTSQHRAHARALNGMRTRDGRTGQNPEVGTLRNIIWEREKEGGRGVGLKKRDTQRERRREREKAGIKMRPRANVRHCSVRGC